MVPVSLTVPQFSTDPTHLFSLAAAADNHGFRGLFVFDHLVPLGDPRRPVMELTSTMGAVAALTKVMVGSLVMRVTLRPPEVSASAVRTLQAIAPGRAIVGLGVGDSMSAEEARRFGRDLPSLDDRLALLLETIDAIRVVAPEVPIWVGGRHQAVRQTAARHADGWNAWGASAEDLSSEAREVRALVGSRPFTISWGGTLLLAPDEVSLQRQIADRGGTKGTVAGTPAVIKSHLQEIGQVVDEIIVSVVPNRPPNWNLFASSVLAP